MFAAVPTEVPPNFKTLISIYLHLIWAVLSHGLLLTTKDVGRRCKNTK